MIKTVMIENLYGAKCTKPTLRANTTVTGICVKAGECRCKEYTDFEGKKQPCTDSNKKPITPAKPVATVPPSSKDASTPKQKTDEAQSKKREDASSSAL